MMDRGEEIMQKTLTDTDQKREKQNHGEKGTMARQNNQRRQRTSEPYTKPMKQQHRKYVKVKYKREILRDKINLQIKKKNSVHQGKDPRI